ncbi:hypothetical protein BOTBODRAFT_451157 [Botryobasidium botryosum FD-172 SS1]|uniref:Secreted protein n=1 Tax=Botryobasidium botryosum (strain FD-172 SS1) TaxID=930990 RepID=A0A067MHZ0_BOTB1|nr:hypothetical protein BOTBODRAFT_451157 [Botryobasidium botryosum FD-172 SS1]
MTTLLLSICLPAIFALQSSGSTIAAVDGVARGLLVSTSVCIFLARLWAHVLSAQSRTRRLGTNRVLHFTKRYTNSIALTTSEPPSRLRIFTTPRRMH